MNEKISAIITDVDGVMIGNKRGTNFPYPSDNVTNLLREVSKKIPIILCSGKYRKTITELIFHLELNNFHIADGGSSIFNPYTDEDYQVKFINENFVSSIISTDNILDRFHIEFYFKNDYKLVENSKINNFVLEKRIAILDDKPVIISKQSIINLLDQVLKIVIIVKRSENYILDNLVKNYKTIFENVDFFWTSHPYLQDYSLFVITPKNVSKRQAVKQIIKKLNLSNDVLGIGDSLSDWNFMQDLKYVACIKNNQICDLEAKIISERSDNYIIAKSVDQDGLADVLNSLI